MCKKLREATSVQSRTMFPNSGDWHRQYCWKYQRSELWPYAVVNWISISTKKTTKKTRRQTTISKDHKCTALVITRIKLVKQPQKRPVTAAREIPFNTRKSVGSVWQTQHHQRPLQCYSAQTKCREVTLEWGTLGLPWLHTLLWGVTDRELSMRWHKREPCFLKK